MKLIIESYPSQKMHFLVAHHEEGQGYESSTSVSTTIGRFPSRKQAEEAKEALIWFGDHRWLQGLKFERQMNAVQGSKP